MKLLNTKSRKLSNFVDRDVPPYVILSHTWGVEEVTFQDISGPNPFQDLKGYQKIDSCCRQAVADGYEYVWIDTCCIDKKSSAELSEAINSMFEWYRESDVCYAFLCDVNTKGTKSWESQLGDSKWFTRGWTLQELIAPRELVFYDSQWVEIGTKLSLCNQLSDITGIHARILKNELRIDHDMDFNRYSVACRMSWASKRITTRIEDMAYCLMGIFGVNMPLLYGEGEKAFRRLQEEIMKKTDDHSLFAWVDLSASNTGVLATSPREFSESRNVVRIPDIWMSPPFSMTNKGVQITSLTLDAASMSFTRVEKSSDSPTRSHFFAFQIGGLLEGENDGGISVLVLLNCHLSNVPYHRLGLLLHRYKILQVHSRKQLDGHVLAPMEFSRLENTKMETIFIEASTLLPRQLGTLFTKRWCTIRSLPVGFQLNEKYPKNLWSHSGSDLHLTAEKHIPPYAELTFQDYSGNEFTIMFRVINQLLRIGIISYPKKKDRVQIQLGPHIFNADEYGDRITHKLKEDLEVLASIKKCPGGYVTDISIQSKLSESRAITG